MPITKSKKKKPMKFAAIKGRMGIWKYYVSALTFGEIATYVSRITDEISNSDSFKNLLQRTITDNVDSIKKYLLNQPERLFNAIVLAIYEAEPQWFELDVQVEEYNTYSVGVLELSGEEIIFPVDGQHRVEGIKKAIKENPELENEKVPVILIGHENSDNGKKRTRRLFSTLNRRAKRVKDNELIALDEDDVVAIATREMAENHKLFKDYRLVDYANKNIPSTNGLPFTSILALYEVNKILYFENERIKQLSKEKQAEYLLYRPEEQEVNEFIQYISDFWDAFIKYTPQIAEYCTFDENEVVEHEYRSKNGGNLLFRPIALSQYVNAVIFYKNKMMCSMENALEVFSKIPMEISGKPWKGILWLEERHNINGRVRKKDLFLLILALVDWELLEEKERKELVDYILSSRDLEKNYSENVMKELKSYSGKK